MSIARIHQHYHVSIHTDNDVSEVLLDGILRQSLESGLEVRGQATSGNPYTRFQAIVAGNPMARFGTHHIAKALDSISLIGKAIFAETNPGVKLFAYAHDEGATRKSGASHRQYLLRRGIILPRTLTCDHQGDAELDYEILITYDGTNDPIVESDGVTLSALPGDDQRFTIGPVSIGGVALPQIRRLEVDFGLTATARGADSDIHPTFASINRIEPRVTLRGVDVEWLKAANIPRTGKAATHLNSAIYLRKRTNDGTFVPDATLEHIQVTPAGLATVQTIFDADGDSEAECTLEVRARHDGTNSPLVVDTTAAIP